MRLIFLQKNKFYQISDLTLRRKITEFLRIYRKGFAEENESYKLSLYHVNIKCFF